MFSFSDCIRIWLAIVFILERFLKSIKIAKFKNGLFMQNRKEIGLWRGGKTIWRLREGLKTPLWKPKSKFLINLKQKKTGSGTSLSSIVDAYELISGPFGNLTKSSVRRVVWNV